MSELERVPTGELDLVPAIIARERAALAAIVDPRDAVDAERRAAAIAELARRGRLAVEVRNQATLLRVEAFELVARTVDDGQRDGWIAMQGRPENLRSPEVSTLADVGVDYRRLAEARRLVVIDASAKLRERLEADPAAELPTVSDLIRSGERAEREVAVRAKRERLEAEARAARLAAGTLPPPIDVADIRHYTPPAPLDAIITDPPYITGDALELYGELARLACESLVEGGVLAAMAAPWALPDVLEVFGQFDELAYRWTIAWRYGTHANTVDYPRRVFDLWKPILVYHRGAMPADAPTWADVIDSPGREKELHAWQQSLAGFELLVTRLTWPGALICDPFAGAGTTAVAALRHERRFVGCDVDEAAVAEANARIGANA